VSGNLHRLLPEKAQSPLLRRRCNRCNGLLRNRGLGHAVPRCLANLPLLTRVETVKGVGRSVIQNGPIEVRIGPFAGLAEIELLNLWAEGHMGLVVEARLRVLEGFEGFDEIHPGVGPAAGSAEVEARLACI